ncbi:MAG: hypothetical protein ABSD03_02570 [Vulcanimicrobiaceae bacterium]|jgi:hypothetical protein
MVEQPVENVFVRAWGLLTRNWVIIVPGVIVGLIVGLVNALVLAPAYIVSSGDVTITRTVGVGGGLLAGLVALVGYIVTVAYTTGMAGAAWARGTATLGDGTVAFQRDVGRIVLVGIGLVVLALVAAIIALPTLGLSLLAFYLFTLYAFPSAIVGDRQAMDALTESFRLTIARFVPTLIIAIVIAVLSVIGHVIGGAFSFTPLIGPVVSAVITQAVVAYATLVIVGEYLNLRAANQIPPAPPPAAAPPA